MISLHLECVYSDDGYMVFELLENDGNDNVVTRGFMVRMPSGKLVDKVFPTINAAKSEILRLIKLKEKRNRMLAEEERKKKRNRDDDSLSLG